MKLTRLWLIGDDQFEGILDFFLNLICNRKTLISFDFSSQNKRKYIKNVVGPTKKYWHENKKLTN